MCSGTLYYFGYLYHAVTGNCYVRVQASIAEAVVRWNCLPGKMNPIVRPLMDSLRREENFELQVSALLLLTCHNIYSAFDAKLEL